MADYGEVEFVDGSEGGTAVAERPPANQSGPSKGFPKPILDISEERQDKFKLWLDQQLETLINEQQPLIREWAAQEKAYRARSHGPLSFPFVGASGDVVPLIAMAVDPIFARLDVGLFKTERIMKLKALRKKMIDMVDPLEAWVDFYFRHYMKLRQVFQPRLLDFTKHGTMVFKTVYDDDTFKVQTYDREWNVIEKKITRFKGPRIFGIDLQDFLFSPSYQTVQECPIIAQKMRPSMAQLYEAEAAGKLTNCDKLKNQEVVTKSELDEEREDAVGHKSLKYDLNNLVIYEVWCDYDINEDKLPERIVATYHRETRTLLQLRYNWYFHQRKPFTVIPYQIVNNSLYGLGLCEMILPFQDSATQWHRMAMDNAYLANIRMFIAKKDSGIEENPRLYSGRVFRVDDPTKDFIPFQAADIYNSTLAERQNIMGLTEKRTGVSDYLTGRESPIVGSRATATSTLALIKEGTQRVEEVLENVRNGLIEMTENAFYIWMQYGLDGLDELVFGDEDMITKLKDFFDMVDEDNINGAIALDIAAIDASNNSTVQQQVRLAIINVMMQYLQKVLEAGQAAIQAEQTMPQYSAMVGDVMTSARKMFKDLLTTYQIRNPDDYLPDLEKYLNGGQGAGSLEASAGGAGGLAQPPAGPQGPQGVPMANGRPPAGPQPSAPGSGGGAGQPAPVPQAG